VLARGRRAACPDGVVYVLPRPAAGAAGQSLDAVDASGPSVSTSRLAVVAGRRLGSAVQRNRAKRRLRAAAASAGLPPGYDFVVVARSGALTTPFAVLVDHLAEAVRRVVGATLTVAA
jgi:ribonuclease P protein component